MNCTKLAVVLLPLSMSMYNSDLDHSGGSGGSGGPAAAAAATVVAVAAVDNDKEAGKENADGCMMACDDKSGWRGPRGPSVPLCPSGGTIVSR